MYFQIHNEDFCKTHRGKVWVNDKLKIGHLCVPKCASSGVRSELKLNNVLDYNDVPKDYKIFTIIREPIERFISAYIEVTQASHNSKNIRRFNYNIAPTFKGYEIRKFLNSLFNSNKSHIECFNIYLYNIISKWKFFEPHCVPFIYYLTDNENNLQKNLNIFKLEKDKDKIKEFLGIKNFNNSNKCKNSDLKNILMKHVNSNVKIKNKIIELYRIDIDFYNDFYI